MIYCACDCCFNCVLFRVMFVVFALCLITVLVCRWMWVVLHCCLLLMGCGVGLFIVYLIVLISFSVWFAWILKMICVCAGFIR